jgi:hypothetical protein
METVFLDTCPHACREIAGAGIRVTFNDGTETVPRRRLRAVPPDDREEGADIAVTAHMPMLSLVGGY